MKLLYSAFIVATVALCLAAVSNSHPLQQVEPLVTEDEKSSGPLSREELNAAAYVVSGSIVAFTPNVPLQGREDVVNATLFTQLAGNNQFNRGQEPGKWYNFYNEVLSKIAFILTSSTSFQQVMDPTFTMEDILLSMLKPTTSTAGLAAAKSAIDYLGEMASDSRAVQLFLNNATGNTRFGNFQVIVCDEVNGEPTISFGMAYFNGPRYNPGFLWNTVSSKDVTMFAGVYKYTLNEAIYASVRETIRQKLGNRINTLVATLKI